MKSITIKVYVQPGAKKSEISGKYADAIKVRIHSPPVKGKANEELISFLSEALGLHKSALKIKSGDNSRTKTITLSYDSEADRVSIENKLSQLTQSHY